MLEQVARISSVSDKKIIISPLVSSSCSGCHKKCATASIAQALCNNREIELSHDHLEFNLSAGDQVVIGVHESNLVKSAIYLYLIPLCSLFLGTIAGAGVSALVDIDRNLFAAMGGMFGLISAYLTLRRSARYSDSRLIILRKLP
jgi:sigma-E factor negative regulatory protein RseC